MSLDLVATADPESVQDMRTSSLTYQGRRAQRAGSEARRVAILEAALRIIAREGMRGVRHRAVAAEAGVPLAATTYYFKDLDDLITDAFNFFAERMAQHTQGLMADVAGMLDVAETGGGLSIDVARHIVERVTDYIMRQQEGDLRADRVIQQAFLTEALLNERLRSAIVLNQKVNLEDGVSVFRRLGSVDPEADGRVAVSTIMQMEYEVLVGVLTEREVISSALWRQLVCPLGITTPWSAL